MKKFVALFAVLVTSAGLAQTVDYWLWDANQLPAYEACAEAFEAQNPDIDINIELVGWADYWTSLTTSLVSGTAPDVFTLNISKLPEYAANGQVLDLAPLIARDNVPLDVYLEGLVELWGRDDAQYGLPKDWDTVAVLYNTAMLEAAGVSVEELGNATWNPQDGGTFEDIIARLTLDANGNNGLSPDFDPNNVEQYGFAAIGGDNPYGQTFWSTYAVSNGWRYNDGPYSTEYYYDDPKFIEAIDWYVGLSEKGYAPKWEEVSGVGGDSFFASQGGALYTDGSWKIRWYDDNAAFEHGFAPLPIGPEGRQSMFNGLADGIWAQSPDVEQAWEWVKFMGTAECQNIVGSYAVVFPAIPEAIEVALNTHAEAGRDVQAFVDEAQNPDGLFLYPITDYASAITDIMAAAMQQILLRQGDIQGILEKANEQVNALF